MPAARNLIGRRSLFGLVTTVAMSEGTPEVVRVFRVQIADFAFDPPRLLIPVGARVVWRNADEAPHRVVHDSDPPAFRSRALFTGERFSFTFERSGDFAYVCGMHRHMRGLIVVR